MCWSKECRNAELHNEGIETWVEFLTILKRGGVASNDRVRELADADDDETLGLLIELDFYHEHLLIQKRELDQQIRSAQRG